MSNIAANVGKQYEWRWDGFEHRFVLHTMATHKKISYRIIEIAWRMILLFKHWPEGYMLLDHALIVSLPYYALTGGFTVVFPKIIPHETTHLVDGWNSLHKCIGSFFSKKMHCFISLLKKVTLVLIRNPVPDFHAIYSHVNVHVWSMGFEPMTWGLVQAFIAITPTHMMCINTCSKSTNTTRCRSMLLSRAKQNYIVWTLGLVERGSLQTVFPLKFLSYL